MEKNNSLHLIPEERSQTNGVLPSAAVCLLTSIGAVLTFSPALPSAVLPAWAAVLLCAVVGTAMIPVWRSRFSRPVLLIGFGVFLLTAIVMRKPLSDGVALLYNDLTNAFSRQTGRLLSVLGTSENASPLFAELYLCLYFVFLLSRIAVYGAPLPPILFAAVTGIGILIGPIPCGFGFLCLFCGAALSCVVRSAGQEKKKRNSLPAPLAILPALAVVTGLFCGLFPLSTQSAVAAFSDRVHNVVYHHGSQAMPEGMLSDLGSLQLSDDPALTVTMEQPQKTYLRGFIGEEYTGTAWKPVDGEKAFPDRDLFYWLHQDGFYGDKMLGAAYRSLQNTELCSMEIRQDGACRKYAYQPYAAAAEPGTGKTYIGDARLYADGSTAEISCYPGGLRAWYALQQRLIGEQDSPDVAKYLADANAYRAYVDKTALDVPEEALRTLQGIFSSERLPENTAQVKQAILQAVGAGLTYREKAVTLNGENDFLTYVLQQHTGGYSVHYATAATLMFRYFGIPARYVEGYLIKQTDAEKMRPGEPFALTQKHAHAWAEYYIDGIGWLPFECTPGYMDDDDRFGSDDTLPDQQYISEAFAMNERTEQDDLEEPQLVNPPKKERFPHLPWLRLLWLLPLLFLLLLFARTRWRARKRWRRINALHAKEAAPVFYARSSELIEKGIPFDGKKEKKAKALNDEALFSTHDISSEQLREQRGFYEELKRDAKKHWKPLVRFYNYWIKGIY